MAVMFVFLIVAALVIFYLYLTRNYKYWQKRGIPCPDGIVPGIGHFWEFLTMKTDFSESCSKIYNANQGRSMVGVYNFTSPMLIVRDLDMVKTILQTKFTSFNENGFKINLELDPLLASNPFFTYGDKWVTARKRMIYAFSNMRLKILLETVKEVCEKFESYLDKKLNKTGKMEVELKDLFSRFTAQVVSSAGFGVDGMCFDEEKERESFYAIGKARFLPLKTDRFFRSVIAHVIEQRRFNNNPRNDFLQQMVDLERTESDKIDLEILTSHAVSFFIDGYDTSSTVLSFVGFQLASHPEVQKKLREEMLSVLEEYDGVLSYDALKDMTYMDQVINESQRLVPALGFLIKICTEECELKGSDGLACRVEPGTQILIPVQCLQIDPRYWENPKKFDPERFSPENKRSIEKFAFLPFGEGPRNCVGMRMAQLQMKACLATFLRKYSLELSPRTRIPLKLAYPNFMALAEHGVWAYIRPLKT